MTYESCGHECAVHKPYARKIVPLTPLPQKPGDEFTGQLKETRDKMLEGVRKFHESLQDLGVDKPT